tara:strand:- start:165 stop:701 length:537 start_codon:yes stop_codon:yes gene_type:complete
MDRKLTKEKILEKINITKICSYCKEPKQYEELVKRTKYKGTDIYSTTSYCKKCSNKRREERRKNNPLNETRKIANKKRNTKHRELNKDKYCPIIEKDKRLKRVYGVSLEWLRNKLIEVNFTCFICLTAIDEKTGVIDHCHTTNKIRNVICNKCNTAIGFFKDSKENMLRGIDYLNKFG